jgi:hypothetical protein
VIASIPAVAAFYLLHSALGLGLRIAAAVCIFVVLRLGCDWRLGASDAQTTAMLEQLTQAGVEGLPTHSSSSQQGGALEGSSHGQQEPAATGPTSQAVSSRNLQGSREEAMPMPMPPSTSTAWGRPLWLLSFLPWSIGWAGCMIVYLWHLVLSVVIGQQVYVNRMAKATNHLLAVVLHLWAVVICLTVASFVARCLNPATTFGWDVSIGAVAILSTLCVQVAKAAADLLKDCKVDVWSRRAMCEGFALVLDALWPLEAKVVQCLLDATIGLWIVCLARHGKLPCQLAIQLQGSQARAN